MDIAAYLAEIRALHASGQSTEHSFRPALAKLFGSIDPGLTVINEPKHITDVGAPDFVFQRGDVAIGWCEAKDIGKDIKKFAANDYSKAQKDRYRKGLPNLIYTNGLDFEFIRDGEVVDFVTIADLIPTMPARETACATLQARLAEFAHATPLSVTSSKRLAELMAGKAALIKDIMGNALVADMKAKDAGNPPTDLIGQYGAFKANLIGDITVAEFADIYAETIAYGLFAARLHDETPASFTRAEALELLPKSNPFLRELFIYIAGPNLDDRLRRPVDDLCAVFLATNMEQVLRHFGKVTRQQDPFLHFYEVFLAEYNPAKRKARGVWYTPEPVVNFIVRAVDEVLQTEFGLPDGLADTSRISIDWDTGQNDPKTGKPATIKRDVHRVQILDPATGTGTFLAEVVKLVAERVKGIAPGKWSGYVEQDLIPRIHGFELLMASYAMCHMKLDMILTGLGYKPSGNPPRLGAYLTNSLEEGERVDQTLFGLSRAIAEEAKAASDIKRQTPIMCVIGNPPYSGESSNKGEWIMGLMDDYKKEPGGKKPLNERNPKWINDDYVKFIRFAEEMISRNKSGVVGFITNHGFLDNPTFRGMRWRILKKFDEIYILDLHGNSNRKEQTPPGAVNKNVFDIKAGVSIAIFIRRAEASTGLARVRHAEVWGDRDSKYEFLTSSDLQSISWNEIVLDEPHFMLVPWDYDNEREFRKGFSLEELMPVHSNGVVTGSDAKFISDQPDNLIEVSDGRQRKFVQPIAYRPFERSYVYYDPKCLERARSEVMEHYLLGANIGLLVTKAFRDRDFAHVWVTKTVSEAIFLSGTSASNAMNLPLYIYPPSGGLDAERRVNFDRKIFDKILRAAELEHGDGVELKVFDYIYGALYVPSYRSRYRQALSIDFPFIPFPASAEQFRSISQYGNTLRRLHLMEDAAIRDTPYPFHGEASEGEDCVVDKPRFELQPDGTGRVYINGKGGKGQYFEGVPAVSWGFPIGGYQPAQKWLKDRKGRALSYDDIRHYQKIIKILAETDRIMRGIELPLGTEGEA